MLSLMRHPLVQFFLLGGALFLVYRQVQPPTDDPRRIHISAGLVEGLRQDQLRRLGALPSADDEAALVQRYVDDEILQREAAALGLGRGDIIIRRRLIQKMEFVLENSDPPGEPTDEDLRQVLRAHPERYALPPRTSLQHIFVSKDRHPSDGAEEASRLRVDIEHGTEPRILGEPFLQGLDLPMRSDTELTNLFGPEFVTAVHAMRLGVWSQPIASRFGWHLVLVRERGGAVAPPLDSIRVRVTEDWRADQRERARLDGLAELRRHYTVTRTP